MIWSITVAVPSRGPERKRNKSYGKPCLYGEMNPKSASRSSEQAFWKTLVLLSIFPQSTEKSDSKMRRKLPRGRIAALSVRFIPFSVITPSGSLLAWQGVPGYRSFPWQTADQFVHPCRARIQWFVQCVMVPPQCGQLCFKLPVRKKVATADSQSGHCIDFTSLMA